MLTAHNNNFTLFALCKVPVVVYKRGQRNNDTLEGLGNSQMAEVRWLKNYYGKNYGCKVIAWDIDQCKEFARDLAKKKKLPTGDEQPSQRQSTITGVDHL